MNTPTQLVYGTRIFSEAEIQSCSPVNDEVEDNTAAAERKSLDIVFPLEYSVLSGQILKIGVCLPSVYVVHLCNRKVILLTQ